MPASHGRFDRLLLIITILQQQPGVQITELAQQAGVSQRSLFRDLQTLRKAGIPVLHDNAGYRLGSEFRLPHLSLTEDQSKALRILPQLLRNFANQPQFRDALIALQKIQTALPYNQNTKHHGPVTNRTRSTPAYISFRRPDVGIVNDDQQWFTVLSQAIEESVVCRIHYQPAGQLRPEVTDFQPLHLHFWNRAWYVVGFSRLHQMKRMLKLTRIREINLLSERFTPDKSFSIDEYLGSAWGLQSGEHNIRVVVRFSPTVARNVTEVVWHHTQRNIKQPDGSVIIEFVVAGIQEISWWIAGYGDQAFVIEPLILQNRLRDMFSRLNQLYQMKIDPTRLWGARTRAGKKSESESAGKTHPPAQRQVGDADIVVRQNLPVNQPEILRKPTPGE